MHATAGTPFTNAEVGDLVRNTTESKIVRITAVIDANNVDTEAVTNWSGDSFNYNVLVETYATGRNVYAPVIEKVTSATSASGGLVFTANKSVQVNVRRSAATAILPFSQDATFISTGVSVSAVRTNDDIIT